MKRIGMVGAGTPRPAVSSAATLLYIGGAIAWVLLFAGDGAGGTLGLLLYVMTGPFAALALNVFSVDRARTFHPRVQTRLSDVGDPFRAALVGFVFPLLPFAVALHLNLARTAPTVGPVLNVLLLSWLLIGLLSFVSSALNARYAR